MQAPMPKNAQQLWSFLGPLNYYCKFLPNLATILQPLNDLLQKGKKWSWSAECTQAVHTAKELLTTSNLLTHYDPTKPIKLAAEPHIMDWKLSSLTCSLMKKRGLSFCIMVTFTK